MAGRGPAPTPTSIKRKRGNPGDHKLNDHEAQPDPVLPDPPEVMDDVAREEWHRLAQELYDLGLLTRIDRNTLAAYCQAFSVWVKATEHVKQYGIWELHNARYDAAGKRIPGTGELGRSVALNAMFDAMQQMKTYGQELGLSPSARSRIKVESKEPDDEAFFTAPKPQPLRVVNDDSDIADT